MIVPVIIHIVIVLNIVLSLILLYPTTKISDYMEAYLGTYTRAIVLVIGMQALLMIANCIYATYIFINQ